MGDSGFEFPFGNTFEAKFCNVKESEVSRTNLVTDYAKSKTHFGTIDMAGNVWEWCANEGLNPQNIQLSGTENRVLKGGSWNNTLEQAKISHRIHRNPRSRTFNIGFRVVAEL